MLSGNIYKKLVSPLNVNMLKRNCPGYGYGDPANISNGRVPLPTGLKFPTNSSCPKNLSRALQFYPSKKLSLTLGEPFTCDELI